MGKKILTRDCSSKSQKANEVEVRFHLASSELQLPLCYLKTHCPGFTEPPVLGGRLGRVKDPTLSPFLTLAPSTYPDQSTLLFSSAANLDQATITFCLDISNSSIQSPVSPLVSLKSTSVYTTARKLFEKVN